MEETAKHGKRLIDNKAPPSRLHNRLKNRVSGMLITPVLANANRQQVFTSEWDWGIEKLGCNPPAYLKNDLFNIIQDLLSFARNFAGNSAHSFPDYFKMGPMKNPDYLSVWN